MKWAALILMTIDHLALYFTGVWPNELVVVCRLLGRLAFPVFAYQLSLGYSRTQSLPKYILRTATFATAGQAVMELVASHTGAFVFRNVLFTFTFSLIVLLGFDLMTKSISDMVATMRPATNTANDSRATPPGYGVKINVRGISLPSRVGFIAGLILLVIGFTAVILINSDYSYYGILTVLLFHIVNEHTDPLSRNSSTESVRKFLSLVFRVYLLLNVVYLVINVVLFGRSLNFYLMQCFSVFAVALFPLERKSRKPGKISKYFFYVYYPAHLVLIMWLSAIL